MHAILEFLLDCHIEHNALVRTAAWVDQLDEAITRISRLARSPQLHERVARAADVQLGEHLHLTVALVAAWQPIRVTDLAGRLDVERSTVSRRVGELVRLGLVARTVDAADRRAAAITLTAGGEQLIGQIEQAWHGLLADAAASLEAERRSTTIAVLFELADALEAQMDV